VAVAAGDLVRAERQRRGLSLRDLAAKAGISISSLATLEVGRATSVETYARISTALGLRLEMTLTDPRRRSSRADESDVVHAAMGDAEARHLRSHGFEVRLDVPYQHYQFAGRGDLVACHFERRALLHLENRTRFPDVQQTFGSYNAKRAYLADDVATCLGLRGSWRSQTHVMVALWSAEVLHTLRLRTASFEAVCPDTPDSFAGWWMGTPPTAGASSSLVVFDPDPGPPSTRRRRFAGLAEALRADPRYRDYADAARALR
jgi:transcriptional regulator with XRE-family HTH domain